MFNFGWGELVLIGIVALIAIGPKELPTVLRTIGLALGKVRRMANEFQGQFQEALREADIADLKKHADDMTSSFNETVTDFTKYDPLADTQKDLEKDLDFDTPTPVATDTATAELPAPEAQNDKALELNTAAEAAAPTSSAPASEIDVPLPDAPAAVTEKNFAAAESTPAESAPKKPRKKKTEQAGGDA